MEAPVPVPVPPTRSSSNNTGLVAGVVLGVVTFILLKAWLIHFFCQRRQRRLQLLQKQQPEQGRARTGEEWFEQLKEQEFHCHHIHHGCSSSRLAVFKRICVDADGNEVELGRGGFGRVVKGIRDGLQPVAIKMMFNTDRKAREDFMKEIKMLKSLSRDGNIVQYFGASFQEDQLWLVTEFMEGGDLRKALSADTEDENRLTWWNGGKQIALDTAKGLAFLHSQHVIHRDIKSQNILLTGDGRAKIADVGMAQILSADHYANSINSQHGTFSWAAPELVMCERCTEKADIYSFGTCLWEIVTSEMPLRSKIFRPSARDCPPGVAHLIEDCMRRDPHDRPSALEIYRRLQDCEPLGADNMLMDSAEGGGTGSCLETARDGRKRAARWRADGRAHGSRLGNPPVPGDRLPTSNAAFTQLAARFASGSDTLFMSNPEDIMASSSVDADLSHIPSVHDSAMAGGRGLPDFVLTISHSRVLDYAGSQSSEDLFASNAGYTTISLPTMTDCLRAGEDGGDHLAVDVAQLSDDDLGSLESEETGTIAVAVASVQGYAGSSQPTSRLNTGTHNSDTGSVCADEPAARDDPATPTDESTAAQDTFEEGGPGGFAAPGAAASQPAASARTSSLHTGASSLHTGSTAYEDAEDHAPWYK